MIEVLKVVILAIIEGITEWLPISSTGHMILAEEFLRLNVDPKFWEVFLVVIQLGAILAVVTLFFQKLNPFAQKNTTELSQKETWHLWGKIIIACLPAALIGLPLDDWLNEHFYNYYVVAMMLIIYGILFIVVENATSRKQKSARVESFKTFSYKMALGIGLFQVLALIPGTSRSGATIIGGMLLGASRFVATEFSFFLSIPVMFGASLVKLLHFGLSFSSSELGILILGMVVAFLVSIVSIKFLLNYLKRNDFKAFGYYRIILGIIVLIYFFIN